MRALAALALALLAAPAAAHQTSLARLDVAVAGREVTLALRVSGHDLAVALGIATDLVAPVPPEAFAAKREALHAYVRDRLLVRADEAPCALAEPPPELEHAEGEVTVRALYRCPRTPTLLVLHYGAFFDIDPRHRAVGVVRGPEGTDEVFIEAGYPRVEVALGGAAAVPFARLLGLGVEHILLGFDHVLFVVALVIAASRPWALLAVITAFTVGHSLTLGLAWLGALSPPARLVESLIAASIVVVAVENLLGRGRQRRWLIAFGFGLVHGLGFYGALADLGLGEGDLVRTLLGFNLGVELGQLAVVAAVGAPLLWALRRPWYPAAMRAASAAIALVALVWLVERALPA